MKLLILTQYFPPEVGAPQNRLYELAVRLKNKGVDVTILTAMPNYPQMKIHKGYEGKRRCVEEMNGLKVYRSRIYVSSKKGIFFRLRNYFSFVQSSFWCGLFRLGKFDYIFCESPPLFLGISAYLLKLFKRSKLIFNVSDLWPESAQKLGIVTNKFFLGMAGSLERFMYRRSELICGQTQGIVKNISGRFPQKNVYWLPNGVDVSFYNQEPDMEWKKQVGIPEESFLILYAGIIGHAQGLEVVLHAAEKLKNKGNIVFALVGSGPEKEKLEKIKQHQQLDNVRFFETVSKNEMPAILASSDAAVIPLKKIDLFKGAIPSKIFEVLAMKKPVLLGVDGEAKKLFIDDGNCGLFFEPENSFDLAEKVMKLYNDRSLAAELGENGRKFVAKKFNRDTIAAGFYDHLVKLHENK